MCISSFCLFYCTAYLVPPQTSFESVDSYRLIKNSAGGNLIQRVRKLYNLLLTLLDCCHVSLPFYTFLPFSLPTPCSQLSLSLPPLSLSLSLPLPPPSLSLVNNKYIQITISMVTNQCLLNSSILRCAVWCYGGWRALVMEHRHPGFTQAARWLAVVTVLSTVLSLANCKTNQTVLHY